MGILQSLGDSKSPVIYLIISACLNVILDLVLIGGLGFGVGAAAFCNDCFTDIKCGSVYQKTAQGTRGVPVIFS